MNAFGKFPELSVSLDHALFSMMLKKKKRRVEQTDAQKFKFVDDEYNEYLERLL